MLHVDEITPKEAQSQAIERSIRMPQVTISEDQLPEILDWEVGQTYRIELIVEQRSLEFVMFEGDKKEARFLVISAKALSSEHNSDHED